MQAKTLEKRLLIAIGNDARQDDGLGWAFGNAVESRGFFAGEVTYRYQLQIEDAEFISCFEEVIFVDAFKGKLPGGYSWSSLTPALEFGFTTHALAPDAVLALCHNLYARSPKAWLMAISGECWALEQGLGLKALQNLSHALIYFDEIQQRAYSG
jgi:hydrogenase maturation protease